LPLVLQGLPAAPGLAKGQAQWQKLTEAHTPPGTSGEPETERRRLEEARRRATAQLRELAAQLRTRLGAPEAAVLEAQAMFPDDPALVRKAETAIEAGLSADAAWKAATDEFAQALDALPDETLRARAADVRDVRQRVIDILLGTQTGMELERPVVLLARDLTPSQTASLDPSKVLAFCTMEGGSTSHTAILAKALGIPAVVGIGETLRQIQPDDRLLVDGHAGVVTLNPDVEMERAFDADAQRADHLRDRETQLAHEPALTKDGHRVLIAANIAGQDDALLARDQGAEGVGLLRTEFLFLGRERLPDEDTQTRIYSGVLDAMGSRPVVVRTLDIGGDKEVSYYDFGAETNPFLGYRAIRISLDHPDDFRVQLRALLRAGVDHDLRIMFPMIATLEEVRQAKGLLQRSRLELLDAGYAISEMPGVGIMVEIPSAVVLADRLVSEVDFLSIGTNDLTQYMFAAERGNKNVSALSDPCHPAMLRAIRSVADAAHAAHKPVAVCGEMAGDPDAIPLLLGLGMDELSMAPVLIPHAKAVIRGWTLDAASRLALASLQLDSDKSVRAAIAQANPVTG
jgi:phosphoenolpyruvate-protein phosphotransferase